MIGSLLGDEGVYLAQIASFLKLRTFSLSLLKLQPTPRKTKVPIPQTRTDHVLYLRVGMNAAICSSRFKISKKQSAAFRKVSCRLIRLLVVLDYLTCEKCCPRILCVNNIVYTSHIYIRRRSSINDEHAKQ